MAILRGALGTAAGLTLGAAVTLSVLRNVETGSRVLAMATSFASYAVVGYLFALLVLLLLARRRGQGRRWFLGGVVLALAGLLVNAWWLAPLYVGSGAGTRTDLTVMTSNLEFGMGDPNVVMRTVTDRKVDVLVLEEVTPIELHKLRSSGLSDLFPHSAGSPSTSASGTMVFSRFDLRDVTGVPVSHAGVELTVAAPKPFRLIAVHLAQPVDQTSRWTTDLNTVRGRAIAARRQGPVIVAGDFNATRDHPEFRRILATGLSDADDVANSGWQPTWPTVSRAWYLRPLVTIDHVLSSGQFAAVHTTTVDVPGTDHRALVVELERF